MNSILLTLGIFLAGLVSQIILLQIQLFRYHRNHPNAKLISSQFIFTFQNVEEIVLPSLTEGMLLSGTILFSYLYIRYCTGFFGDPLLPTFLATSFLSNIVAYLIVFFFILSVIIGSFRFKIPSLLKFICYFWFLLCFIALLFFFTVRLYLYFENPLYIYQDYVTMYFGGFNAIPLLTYFISIRWLFPNKKKAVIEQMGIMIEKVEDKQFTWQRTFLTIGIQGGILLCNGFWKFADDAAIIGFFVGIMPFLHDSFPKKKMEKV